MQGFPQRLEAGFHQPHADDLGTLQVASKNNTVEILRVMVITAIRRILQEVSNEDLQCSFYESVRVVDAQTRTKPGMVCRQVNSRRQHHQKCRLAPQVNCQVQLRTRQQQGIWAGMLLTSTIEERPNAKKHVAARAVD